MRTSDTSLTDAKPIYANASVIDGEGYTVHLSLVSTTMLCQMKYFRDHGTRCQSSSYTPTMLRSLLVCNIGRSKSAIQQVTHPLLLTALPIVRFSELFLFLTYFFAF